MRSDHGDRRLFQRLSGTTVCLALLWTAAALSIGGALTARRAPLGQDASALALPEQIGPASPAAAPALDTPAPSWREARYVTTQDTWSTNIQSRDYWDRRQPQPSRQQPRDWSQGRSGLTTQPGRGENLFGRFFGNSRAARDEPNFEPAGDGFRTVCVRTCDGYFWPISFSTSEDNFAQDARKCEASCSGNARLYVYPNPGGRFEDMKDLSGRPYARLPTAFLFREKYDAACKCKAHPWEGEARDQHRMYALQASQSKLKRGDTVAAAAVTAEIKALREKMARPKSAAVDPRSAGPAVPLTRLSALDNGPVRHGAVADVPTEPAPPASRPLPGSLPVQSRPSSAAKPQVNIIRPRTYAQSHGVRVMRYGLYSRADPDARVTRIR